MLSGEEFDKTRWRLEFSKQTFLWGNTCAWKTTSLKTIIVCKSRVRNLYSLTPYGYQRKIYFCL